MKHMLKIIVFAIIIISIGGASAIDNATAKMQNLSSANISINVSEYPIGQMTTHDANETPYYNVRKVVTAPVRFAASDDFAGYWFYCFCIVVILIYVYGKSKSVEITSMIMMLLSLMIIVPAMTSAIVVPTSFLTLMYVMCLLGLVGIFYGTTNE